VGGGRGSGPITDRGEPAHVLHSFADYGEMRDRPSLMDVLQMYEDIEFDPVLSRAHPRTAEL
jgi:hypothetical protein